MISVFTSIVNKQTITVDRDEIQSVRWLPLDKLESFKLNNTFTPIDLKIMSKLNLTAL
jgi:hypothetical protein